MVIRGERLISFPINEFLKFKKKKKWNGMGCEGEGSVLYLIRAMLSVNDTPDNIIHISTWIQDESGEGSTFYFKKKDGLISKERVDEKCLVRGCWSG